MEYVDDIFDRAREMAGEVPETRRETLYGLCEAAASQLMSRLRAGVEPAAIREEFVTAAGILALAMYIELGQAQDMGSFIAGRSAAEKSAAQSAESAADLLRSRAEVLLSAYLRDNGFVFRGVRG